MHWRTVLFLEKLSMVKGSSTSTCNTYFSILSKDRMGKWHFKQHYSCEAGNIQFLSTSTILLRGL